MRKSEAISLGIIALSFAIGACLYPQMPGSMASHWNAGGQVDGHMPRLWALSLMPVVSLLMLALFVLIPRIDPLRSNIEKFRRHYDGLVVLLMGFLFYVYLLTVFWNLGGSFDMTRAMAPAVGILFYYIGILMENAKRNWFVGIRTPWTLSSDEVWDKTHRIGGKLFRVAGIITMLGIFFRRHAIWLIIAPVIVVAAYAFAYSYFEYRRIEKRS